MFKILSERFVPQNYSLALSWITLWKYNLQFNNTEKKGSWLWCVGLLHCMTWVSYSHEQKNLLFIWTLSSCDGNNKPASFLLHSNTSLFSHLESTLNCN